MSNPYKEKLFAQAIHYLKRIAFQSVGNRYGKTKEEQELYSVMQFIMHAYQQEYDSPTYIEYTNPGEPVELKRMLQSRCE